MQLERVVANDLRRAFDEVKQRFGDNALIVSNQKIGRKIELVVAIDIESITDPNEEFMTPIRRAVSASRTSSVEELDDLPSLSGFLAAKEQPEVAASVAPEEEDNSDLLPTLGDFLASRSKHSEVSKLEASEPARGHGKAKLGFEESLKIVTHQDQDQAQVEEQDQHQDQVQLQSQPAVRLTEQAPGIESYDSTRLKDLTSLIQKEFSALRNDVALARRLAMQNDFSLNTKGSELITHLECTGMPPALGQLLRGELESSTSFEQGLTKMQALLTNSLCDAKAPELRGLHVVAGAAGSGKSMLACRLAQQAAKRYGADTVAVISYCDKKPGAWNQQQLFALTTGVQPYRAKDQGGLEALLDELDGYDCVIIDTGSDFSRSELSYIQRLCPTTVHLAIASDVSEYAAKAQLLKFQGVVDALCISRADTCHLPWPLVAALIETYVPIVYQSGSADYQVPLKACSGSAFVKGIMRAFGQHLEGVAHGEGSAKRPRQANRPPARFGVRV